MVLGVKRKTLEVGSCIPGIQRVARTTSLWSKTSLLQMEPLEVGVKSLCFRRPFLVHCFGFNDRG